MIYEDVPPMVFIKKTNHFLIEKEKKRQKILDERFKQAWQDFNTIVKQLINHYQPKRIIQWGSLLDRNQFTEMSDIDIAIEGILSAEIMFQIYGDIMKLSDFDVDIVQLEKIEPEFAEIIKEKGKVIYECKNSVTH